MTTFDDISFVPHPNVTGGVWGFLTLPNGISLSIVGGGTGLYGAGAFLLNGQPIFSAAKVSLREEKMFTSPS